VASCRGGAARRLDAAAPRLATPGQGCHAEFGTERPGNTRRHSSPVIATV